MRKWTALAMALVGLLALGAMSAWASLGDAALETLVSGAMVLVLGYMGGNVGEHATAAWAARARAPRLEAGPRSGGGEGGRAD